MPVALMARITQAPAIISIRAPTARLSLAAAGVDMRRPTEATNITANHAVVTASAMTTSARITGPIADRQQNDASASAICRICRRKYQR